VDLSISSLDRQLAVHRRPQNGAASRTMRRRRRLSPVAKLIKIASSVAGTSAYTA